MHRLWWFLNIWWASNQTTCHLVPLLFNLTKPFPTQMFAACFRPRWFMWPCWQVKSTTSAISMINPTSRGSTRWIFTLMHAVSSQKICFISLPIATHQMLFVKDRSSIPETLFSTHYMGPEMQFANRFGDTGGHCGIPRGSKCISSKQL